MEMKQGTLSCARSGLRANYIAVLGMLIASCGNSENLTAAKSIVVDRQVLFRDIKIQPNAITRLSDGRFVIAGTGTVARALLTDAQGALLWQYTDPATAADIRTGYRSVFYGAVPLSNGGFLLCGSTSPTGHYEINEITILDASGRAVERRVEKPNDDSALTSSGFVKCFPWQDGIVLAGYASDGTRGYSWILKLDHDGNKEWQTIFQGTMMTQGGAASSLVFATPGKSAEQKITVIRVNSKGVSIAKRTIPGHRFVQLRTLAPTDTTRVISYALGGKPTLYTLDESLRDAEQPKDIGDFDATQGCGYALPDNSILLFGHKNSAAIAWISESGLSRVIDKFDSQYKSYVVPEAIPLSANQFVTARYSASVNPNDNGLVMTWLTVK
jgi:hypothetical protein